MESIEIEKCPICGECGKIATGWDDEFYIFTGCDDSQVGPSCDNELDAIRYWNAMMRGLTQELGK